MRPIQSVLSALALAAAAPAAAPQTSSSPVDLIATAAAAGNFETLLTAVRAAGLADVLGSEGPFTVFAPTDAAFAALPEGALERLLQPEARPQLEAILKFHVVPGRVTAAEALAAQTATSLAGDLLTVRLERGRLTVDGASVMANDVEASNGLIHVIDAVLLPPDARSMPAPSSAALIELAIERGVPLFNAGQPTACAAVYEVAAVSLLAHSQPPLSAVARRQLETAVRSRHAGIDAVELAWRLRAALDASHVALLDGTKPEAGADLVVDDFSDAASADAWRVTNDTVMGGRSNSSFEVDGRGTALFAGEVSLENNGGFASVGRPVAAGSLAGAAGLVVRVRGDGQRYRFNVSDRRAVSPDSYTVDFATTAGEWTEIRLPFAAMERSVMGFRPPNAPPIAAGRIQRIGISIGDKQAGPFRLEIDWIRAFPDAE